MNPLRAAGTLAATSVTRTWDWLSDVTDPHPVRVALLVIVLAGSVLLAAAVPLLGFVLALSGALLLAVTVHDHRHPPTGGPR